MIDQHNERTHAQYSPSKLKSLEICPMFREDYNKPTHPITLRGTAMHEAVEKGSIQGSNLDGYERSLVEYCLDFQAEWSSDQTWTCHMEAKLHTPGGQYGFCDVLFIRAHEAVLLDWKFSFRVQTAVHENVAAQAYVWGVFQMYPQVTSVEVHYVYPRLDVISSHTYHRDDCERIQLRVETIIERVKLADPSTAMPTEEICLYCSRKATCSALHKVALPLANSYAKETLAIPLEYSPANIQDPETMSRALQVATILEEWCNSVKAYASQMRREQGKEIPGYNWTMRSGPMVVLNPEAVVEEAKKAGLEDHEIMDATNISISKLADALAKRAERGAKKSKIANFKAALEESGAAEQKPDTFVLQRAKKTSFEVLK